MTINEAIRYLQSRAKANEPVGVWPLEVYEEDLMQYLPDELYARYEAATPEQQCRFLAALADDLQETLETGYEYGFKKLLHDTLDYLEDEGRLDDLLSQLEDKKENEDA